MKIYGFLILMTTAVILFSVSEISALGTSCGFSLGCSSRYFCRGAMCVHKCELPDGDESDKCGKHAKCDKPGKRGAKCVCEDNWDGDNPESGCFLLIS